jgi:hypothetical protein
VIVLVAHVEEGSAARLEAWGALVRAVRVGSGAVAAGDPSTFWVEKLSTCHQSCLLWLVRLPSVGLVEQKLGWCQEQEVEACWIHCSDKDHSLRHKSHQTYLFGVELAVVREVCPWKVAIAEQLEEVAAEQLCGSEVEEQRKQVK